MYYITTATKKIRNLQSRIRAVQGGTSASKTVGILQNLIDFAQTDTIPTLTSVVSETMPHIKKGSELDFLNILKKQGYYDENRWHKTDHQYTFETGSIVEFFSADDAAKVHGPRRDRLFINEANHIGFDTFDQLELRTNEFVYLDWNPTEDFWFYEEVDGKRPDSELIVLNYLDNEAIDPRVKASLELRKPREKWFKVYGLGLRGETEERIYKDWKIVKEIPHGAKLVRYWVDFGFSIDPASIGALYEYDGGYLVHQLAYATGLSNKMIGGVILNHGGKVPVVADSAEPKSIQELREMGLTVIPAVKGPDSVSYGIRTVQDEPISITEDSVETIKEYRKYAFIVDPITGKPTTVPNDGDDHSMDGVRYAITSMPRHIRKHKKISSQPAYESSDPYAKPVEERKEEDMRPMRKPDSWGPKSKFQQSGFESSMPGDNGI